VTHTPASQPLTFRTERRVEFCETDAAGIVHFSSLLLYMEQAEHAFLRSLGLRVIDQPADPAYLDGEKISWPRVRVEADFAGVARFEDILSIEVNLMRLGGKSVSYRFQLSIEGRPVAIGSITAACCQVGPGAALRAVPIPEFIRQRLSPYLCEPPVS
jgi:acyl-CoA thioester hydrolase